MINLIPRVYQKKGIWYAVKLKVFAFFWEMRLGKTLTALRVVRALKAYPSLIVAPFSAFGAFLEALSGEDFTTLDGRKRKARLKRLTETDSKWYLINHDGFRSIPEIANYEWGSIIFDESTELKEVTSRISKFFVNWFKNVKVKIILAGRPDPESRLDFVQQLRFLGVLKMDYYKFRHYYCRLNGFKFVLTNEGEKIISSLLAKYSSFMSLKDAGLSGKIIRMTQTVEISLKARKQYLEIINDLQIDKDRMTIYKPVSYLWARRLFGGFVGEDFIYDHKLVEVKKILTEILPKNTGKIIFANFLKEIYILKLELQKYFRIGIITEGVAVQDRIVVEKNFQAGKLDIVICSQAAQFSHNFSRASELIFYSTPLSLLIRQQFEGRALLSKHLLILDIVCRNTIEEDFIVSLKNKEKESKMMERIVRRLQSVNDIY